MRIISKNFKRSNTEQNELNKQKVQKPEDIHIGIDFGTSYTKVCFTINNQTEIINFESSNDNYKQTLLYYDYCNKIFYYKEPKGLENIEIIEYFKYSMIDNNLPRSESLNKEQLYAEPEILCCIYYIACLIKDVKDRIFKYIEVKKYNITPKWNITMGVPIDNYEDKNKSLYDKILHIAEKLSNSLQYNFIQINELNQFYLENQKLNVPKFQESHFNSLPELYAECLSFLQDRNVPSGLYCVVDIGGATMDMAVIYKESQNNFSIVSKETKPLGIEIIIRRIIKENISMNDVKECLIKNIIQNNINKEALKLCFKEVREMFSRLANEVKNKKIAREALINQKGNLRILIGGGGANYKWYEACIIANRENLKNALDIGYKLDILPIKKWVKSSDINDHRLLISKCLAQPIDNIHEIEGFPWSYTNIEWQDKNMNGNLDDIAIEKYGEIN